MLLMESGFQIPEQPAKVAYLIEKGYPGDQLSEVIAKAQKARAEGQQVLVVRMNKTRNSRKNSCGKTDMRIS